MEIQLSERDNNTGTEGKHESCIAMNSARKGSEDMPPSLSYCHWVMK